MDIIKIDALNDFSELKSIINNMDTEVYDKLSKFHDSFYFYEEGDLTMYAIIDEPKIQVLKEFYRDYNVRYTMTNITKDVLYGFVKIYGDDDFNFGLKKFVKDCLTVDVILDKILEHGIDKLTDDDKILLDSM